MTTAEKTVPHSSSVCYHCGEDCVEEKIEKAGKNFCCYGCQTVFELLNENELCEYYAISDNPGNKIRNKQAGLRYAFLDNEEIKKELLLFADGKLEKVKLTIPSIHCSSCIWLLENLHQLHEGVLHSSINFLRKEVTISYNNQDISLREIAELIFSIGYEAKINLDSLNKNSTKSGNSLALKLGIAGFSFGNIMLLSLPEYFSSGTYFGFSETWVFSYLNIFLALPVFLYSSLDYFSSAYKGLRGKIINIDVPVSIGIVVLFSRSVFDIVSSTGAGYLDSFTGLVFFLLIGKWFQQKTYQGLSFDKDYKAYFPAAITRIVKGKESVIPLHSIRKGDLLLIRNNELIPCDCELHDESANIDYSFVTGESLPVQKKQNDPLFAGGKAINDSFIVKVVKEVSESYLVELWKQDAFKKEDLPKATTLINTVSKYFTMVILGIALLAGLYWWAIDPSKIWTVVTAVLIVACPCALALSIPFTFGNSIRLFGKRGLFMKNAETIEKLATADTIVFDKTGTITDHQSMHLTYHGKELTEADKAALYSICKKSFHPLSLSLLTELKSEQLVVVKNFREITGKGMEGSIDTASYRIGSKKWVGIIDNTDKNDSIYISRNGIVLGSYNVQNQYRDGLEKLFGRLSTNYQLAILSGDNDREKEVLRSIFPEPNELHFQQSPYDKLTFIRKLQNKGRKVIMIGDGLNDAGALKQSEFGISIAENVHHFSPSCDAILNAGSFEQIPDYLRFSKKAMKVVNASIVLSFLYNVVGITLAVKGSLSPLIAAILMPLSSITVVVFITLAVNILARRSKLILIKK